jgi:PAT family beta-lactamase induction signal transducer AmpG
MAALSATQDIAVDAYRADVLPVEERALGVATYLVGYRAAILVSGGLALALSDLVPWRVVYLTMAVLMVPCLMVTAAAPEPPAVPGPGRLVDAVLRPLRRLAAAPLVLLFVALYKVGEHVALTMTTPFLLDLGFSGAEVGGWYHAVGLVATAGGALLGGVSIPRLGLRRALLLFGAVQAVTNLAFAGLALAGPRAALLVGAVLVDNVAGGLATAAFLAWMITFSDPAHSAAELAILTSVSSLAGRLAAAGSGITASRVGWCWFFFLTAAAAAPGLLLCGVVSGRCAPPRPSG